jgi:hypothetical protein
MSDVIVGARNTGNAKPPSKFAGTVEATAQPDPEARFQRVADLAAERGLKLVLGRYGFTMGLRLLRFDGQGKVHEVTPPHGADLETLEAFVQTDPPSLVEAIRTREAYTLAVSRDAGSPAPAPEMTAPLRNPAPLELQR